MKIEDIEVGKKYYCRIRSDSNEIKRVKAVAKADDLVVYWRIGYRGYIKAENMVAPAKPIIQQIFSYWI